MGPPGFFFIFISFSCLLSFLFAFGYGIGNPTSEKRKKMAWGFLLIGIFLFHYIYLNTKLFLIYPHFYLYSLPILFLFGPLLYSILLLFNEKAESSALKSNLHFIPFAISVIYYIYEVLIQNESRLARIQYLQERLLGTTEADIIFQLEPMVKVLSIAGSIHLSIYVFFTTVQLFHFFRWKSIQKIAAVRFLSIILVIVVLANLGSMILGFMERQFGLVMGLFFLSSIPPLIYIIHSIYPTLFDELKEAIQEEKKYKNSQIKNIDLDELSNRIQKLMDTKKIYMEEGLKLNQVAETLEITPHQLSEFINTRTGKTFQNWINAYRVEYAANLLRENPDWAIIRIAYESGFSSKSSFQDAFKKEMGMNPTEFRKKNKIS